MMLVALGVWAQLPANQQPQVWQTSETGAAGDKSSFKSDAQAEAEVSKGTDLTRRGLFSEAIPHLSAAQGRVANEYAADFNLALCYVATGQPDQAIPILTALRDGGHDNADVNNLLAQAYVGDGQNERALDTLQKAATFAPENERLYLFVADACMEKREYGTGLQVVEVGLHHLPDSPWLHYERGMFLALLDHFVVGTRDFELAGKMSPERHFAFVPS